MKGSYGQAAYGVQGAKDTPPGAWLPLGLIDRPTVRVLSGTERINAVGDWNPRELSEGMAIAELSLSIVGFQNFTFLGNAIRNAVTGELPWLSVRVGYDKAADEFCYPVENCKIDSFTSRSSRTTRCGGSNCWQPSNFRGTSSRSFDGITRSTTALDTRTGSKGTRFPWPPRSFVSPTSTTPLLRRAAIARRWNERRRSSR